MNEPRRLNFTPEEQDDNVGKEAAETAKSEVCRRAEVDRIPVMCSDDVLKPLIAFFAERKRRMR